MRLLSKIACLALLTLSSSAALANNEQPSEQILAERAEFQDNKFGVFIHWGIYSMLAQGEWVMHNHNIHYKEYEKLASAFYPIQFDAAEWVSTFKKAGAKYICITTRHHDGFSMYDTQTSDYDIVDGTPFGRDIMKEIAAECAKQGIKLHFYYSTLDWYRDDYQHIGKTGAGTGRPGVGKWENYVDFMCEQITELLTNYGEIGAIWFDGDWDQENNPDFDWSYDRIYALIKELQPNCLIANNHHKDPLPGEDIQIFERDIPGENTAGWHKGSVSELPLETCQTMNGMWGYKIRDLDYKSNKTLLRLLLSTAGRNANLLLNVGPQPNGELPHDAVIRLEKMGEWLNTYGETIYGTRSDIIKPQPWGVATNKGDKIWLHIFPDNLNEQNCTFPSESECSIFVPLTDHKIKSAVEFGNSEKLKIKQTKEGLYVTIPTEGIADEIDFIVELSIK